MRTPSTLFVPLLLLAGACASQSAMPPAANPSPAMASAMSTMPPRPDPRVGLKPGLTGAGEAIWNLRLLSNVPSPPGFAGVTNSDLAFLGSYALQGNYNGFQVWDISRPTAPTLVKGYLCPASQSDVSVYRNLLFVSAEAPSARLDCGTEGVRDTVSHHRIRGIRIFDITDITDPKYIGNVQTCRGSHTHSVLVDPQDAENVYIYISGSAGVRSPNELPGCSRLYPEEDPSSALFRIEVIKVPLAHPEQAAVVSSPRIFQDLAPAPRHGEAPEDIAAQQAALDSARRVGGFIAMRRGREVVLGSGFVTPLLDSIVKARGGTGSPTGADSAALRGSLDQIVAATFGQPEIRPPSGPNQCHDITLYPEVGLAGGACGGYGLLLDIRDPANPIRLDAVADSNFAYWHSATFNNDATKILFTDEWGGGGAPKCRATDKYEWGGDAIFTLTGRKMGFQSYYKMAAPQTPLENCVAHNGSLIPIPGRDIMVQGWYQGGISIFDWTDPGHPKEIAFHDRGPVDSTRMQMGGRGRDGAARVLECPGAAQVRVAAKLRAGAGLPGSARAVERARDREHRRRAHGPGRRRASQRGPAADGAVGAGHAVERGRRRRGGRGEGANLGWRGDGPGERAALTPGGFSARCRTAGDCRTAFTSTASGKPAGCGRPGATPGRPPCRSSPARSGSGRPPPGRRTHRVTKRRWEQGLRRRASSPA